nr:lantibiotic dehydratase [Kitasatospora sp. SID7827]
MREAIEISSPSLADLLERAVPAVAAPEDGPRAAELHLAELRPAALRRAAEAVGRYRLRMATRATPFGLMAAVGTARFGARAEVGWEGGERRAFRPDLGWLLPLLDRLRTDPQVLGSLLLAVDQQAVLRGDRLVLPYLPDRSTLPESTAEAVPGAGRPVAERTVRATPVVRAVVRLAERPVSHAELLAGLAAGFPTAPAEAIAGLVRTLVAQGFLLTDLVPPPHSTDLLGHVLERLPGEHPVRGELAAVRGLLARAAGLPRGRATGVLREARRRMLRLGPAERPLHADLALVGGVVLPEQVRVEVEQAAGVLWRLSPPVGAPEHLRSYHAEFVERYGIDSPVPLAELLDADTGLGPPAGYRRPVGPRGAANPEPARARTEREAARNRVLAELVAGALVDREPGGPLPEVVLDDELLDRLAPLAEESEEQESQAGSAAETPPASLELYAELAADSLAELDAGRFRLVLSPTAGSDRAGATFGRFASHLANSGSNSGSGSGSGGSDPDSYGNDSYGDDNSNGGGRLLAEAAGALPDDDEVLYAHLEFTPYRPRHANIALTPRWLGHRVVVSAFPDPSGPAVLALDDLVVVADAERLGVYSRELGREVRADAHHALNLRTGAPNAARFLQETALGGHRPWQPWDWGAAASSPVLPRVRRGRVVLAPASWRLTAPVPDSAAPYGDWADGLARWRRRWGVPAAVRLLSGDQRISLDLDDPWHRRLLYGQCRADRPTVLQEDLGAGSSGGWLPGPDGAHAAEIVVPLRPAGTGPTAKATAAKATTAQASAQATARTGVPARRVLPAPHPRTVELPGGEWLFARIGAVETRHDEILADRLPELLARVPGQVDRWFFVRYRDPAPHLRLRFHGEPSALTGELLPALHDWAHGLRRSGLAADLRLEGYAPEADRYGGPEVLADAERVFHADSLVALAALRLVRTARGTPGELLAAANLTATARDFLAARPVPVPVGPWVAATYPKSEAHQRIFRTQRAAALRAIGPDGPAAPAGGLLPADAALAGAWRLRAERLAAYAPRLAGPVAGPALASLLHMGHNRLIGIDREAERRAYALARGALEAHRARHRTTTTTTTTAPAPTAPAPVTPDEER